MTGAARAALLEIALRVCADVKENDSLKARQSARAKRPSRGRSTSSRHGAGAKSRRMVTCSRSVHARARCNGARSFSSDCPEGVSQFSA
jgi:hypothetical protein